MRRSISADPRNATLVYALDDTLSNLLYTENLWKRSLEVVPLMAVKASIWAV